MAEITVPVQDDLILTSLRLQSAAQVNRSKWTGTRKVIGLGGVELWSGTVTVEDIGTEVEERQWRAFLFALGGPQNWFRKNLPCNNHSGSRPTVRSGASYGYTLPLQGLTPSTTILLAGQFMTVPLPSGRYRAVCLATDLNSDPSGNATATFRPALTETPNTGATVETLNPFVPLSPTTDTQTLAWDNDIGAFQLDCEEAR